ncbi:sn-glycerol-3-phosphate ABC transporter substrate-binding protein UgpB [Celerinatantimonas yamalensis]|uniref:sn-glycerol-3-phosphate-binding periplasmic protein UgpB n=1 Tax=Celerinatantimonas yamalensis TaxID=559956 RepID=A0ABW9GD59_9GAMM
MKLLKWTACGVAALLAIQAQAATEIQWWHAMGGNLGKKVDQIAADFNKSQHQYIIKPIYKGNYADTMTSAIAAFRAHKQPAIVQVYEVGTATMMSAKQAIYPVYKLMANTHEPFNPKAYLASVTGYYTDSQGHMLSMPFNSSTPVLYYNKTLFKKAGISAPPTTWEQMPAVAAKLRQVGVKCGFTTGWQSWVQLENFAARQNLPFASEDDGFAGTNVKLLFNKAPFVKHISALAKWSKNGTFTYGGRRSDSAQLFYSGQCGMYTGSSASYAGVRDNIKGGSFGVAPLPYWTSMIQKPQNTIIGGASLWVLRGKSKATYQGVAAFFHYLSSAKVQADWHQYTGYLPVTKAAYLLSKKEGFYQKNPGTDVAIKQMTAVQPTVNSKGLRLGNFPQIRDVINEELENVWSGKKTAKQALDSAVARGDRLLAQFHSMHG